MIALLAAFPVLALTAQDPQAVNELRALARDAPDSVLVEAVRRRPMDGRDALEQLLTAGGDSTALAALTAAERLASAYAVAWSDSFLVRRVTRFRSLSLADRQAAGAADSAFEAAGKLEFSAGFGAAARAWREVVRRFELLQDTARIAGTLFNLARVFLYTQELDSAEAYLTRSLDLAQRVGDLRISGDAIATLGMVSDYRDDVRRASELFTRAGEFRKRTGDARGLAMDQNSLGIIAAKQGDLLGARRAFERALEGLRSSGDSSAYSEAAGVILTNFAHLARIEGDYTEAAGHLREALTSYRASGNRVYAASVLRDIGDLEVLRGDYAAAVAAFSEAAGTMRLTGPGLYADEIDARMRLSLAWSRRGDLRAARIELDRAEALASRQSGRGGVSLAPIEVARGDLVRDFNRLAEADAHYTRALRLIHGAKDNLAVSAALTVSAVRRWAHAGMVEVLIRRESYDRAQALLGRLLSSGSIEPQDAADYRLMVGRVARGRGDTAAARRAIGEAVDGFRKLGAATDEASALGMLGDLEVQVGSALAAESLYRAGLTRLGARSAPGVAWPLHAGLAGVLRCRGVLANAADELRAAIAQIERVSGALPLEEQRSAFRADKWDPYVDLALVERARGRTEAAFEASERLRAQQMLDLLARGRVAEGQALGRLASREQDLRRRMAELAQQPEEREGASGMRGAEAGANEALTRAQDEYAALLTEMQEANPAYTALVKGEIAPAPAVRAALAPDEALLEYLVGDSTTVVFVVTKDSVASLDLHVGHAALAARVDFARSALASPTDTASRAARQGWRAPLRRLYQQLVGPVEASGLLAGRRRLLIAPHAELHYLPFAALVRPGTPDLFLVERYVLEYVPSASVWLRLRDRPEPALNGSVLALAPRPAALPGSQAEVAAIRRTYGERALALVGRAATESTFRALAPEREIVHLATHGVLNKHNPLFSFVQLGAGGGADGRLEVHEVFGLALNARLLVLSACQTGVAAGAVADVPPGDDWIGLVQGFLYAGAGNVLATLWPVSDVATAGLMERFYGKLASGQPEAEALALAQRAAARVSGTAHPFFWAGFALVRGR